ncbi:hypothetical protein BDW22DRAFT_1178500 [Trametopsis cervina]|nr:hypothetical protein BDW22DRAFT_1178500 [Trametopsis cervina]
MEKAEAERRRQRRNHMERTRWADARAHYEARWKAFMDPSQDVEYDLSFDDIPWPILVTEIGPVADTKGKGKARLELEDVTAEGIAAFLLPGGKPVESTSTDKDVVKKERRDKLRETMLRFHPDKFEGRIMRRVRDKDKEVVRDAVGRVTRAINDLLAEKEP